MLVEVHEVFMATALGWEGLVDLQCDPKMFVRGVTEGFGSTLGSLGKESRCNQVEACIGIPCCTFDAADTAEHNGWGPSSGLLVGALAERHTESQS